MPLVQTRGAASAQGFGEFAQQTAANYIEDVFSTYLYTGTGANLTITNNIDLSTNGGLVWIKQRSAASAQRLFDTARGATKYLSSNGTAGSATDATSLTAFNSTGFSLGNNDAGDDTVNGSGYTYASWTFREQAKFFDIVTYTGTGSNTTISHALGSVPGCILVKRTSVGNAAWAVYHRSLANTQYLVLNDTAAVATGATWWNSTTPTSAVFSVGTNASVNESGITYIAYLFAHDAGGFGLTGSDNVISCGSVTATGGNVSVNLGYEPQWVLVKNASAEGWRLFDNMRGISAANTPWLFPNTNGAETSNSNWNSLTSTGFNLLGWGSSGNIYIYIAIRRGPMKVPTDATKVFSPQAVNVSAGTKITTGFPVDWQIDYYRSFAANYNSINFSRLTGVSSNGTDSGQCLWTAKTDAEATFAGTLGWDNTGFKQTGNLWPNINNIYWNFGRAPSFFDQVNYTGTGSVRTVAHNLASVPELIIWKQRSATSNWVVYGSAVGMGYLLLNQVDAYQADSSAQFMNNTTPTTSVFTVGSDAGHSNPKINASGATYVAYLFATCAGVSKVGSYTGNGSTQTINCGFTGGARFVLIKCTSATGDWYVYDTARGMTTLTDPYLFLNSTAAEVATLGSVTTVSTGFALNSAILAAINTNAASYIFLAIA